MKAALINKYETVKQWIIKNGLQSLVDVAIFFAILLTFHFLWRQVFVNYLTQMEFYHNLSNFFETQVFRQSYWFNVNVLGLDITAVDNTMYFSKHGYIAITGGCSGLKQFYQWILLMLLFPGPWKHKTWFIPLGLIITHAVNLFRIIGLSIVLINWGDYWQWSHDWLFRPFFYIVMFMLWVWWVEKFKNKQKAKN
ncbi:MAG: archaeosortase/exosortase family protein [Bacteroidales bacterium]|nr:archaeosortase/exosortase family protein [Bacteroidales bacterium]